MPHSSVLERSSQISSTQSLSIYGLGGELSYTQTVISALIDMIEAGNGRGKQKKFDIKRVMTDTNPWAIASVHGSALSVVPIANDIGKLVAENCLTIDKILRMWDALHLLWWYSLEVQHVLACLKGDNVGNIASIHSHHQALIQCSEKLQQLWCKDIVTARYLENPSDLESLWHNIESDLIICRVKYWKNFESAWYHIVEPEFHTIYKDNKRSSNRYHLISYWLDTESATRVIGTSEAIKACQERISALNPKTLISEASTTAHLDNQHLRRWQAVITGPQAIEYYQEILDLDVLDRDFGPKWNFTHFAVFSNKKQGVSGLEQLKQWWRICTIELQDADKEKQIKELLKKLWVNVQFEKIEKRDNWELFTGVLDFTRTNKSVESKIIRQVNALGWRIKLI